MKKRVLLAGLICLLAFPIASSAKIGRTGIKAGLNVTSLGNVKEIGVTLKNHTGFNVGAAWQLDMPLGFALQPELVFSQRGASIDYSLVDATLKMSSLQLPVNLQWGLDLKIVKPFVQFTPYIGYALGKDFSIAGVDLGSGSWKNINRFQYGVSLGVGAQISAFQLSVRYLWDMGSIANFKSISATLSDINKANYKGLEISLAILF